MKPSHLMILAVLLVLSVCVESNESFVEVTISKELTKEVQDVLRRSTNNLVFVKGGSFEMGDVGAYVSEDSIADDERGYDFVDESHPEATWMPWVFAKAGEKRPAQPVHKVTLPSYSIGKYEVTFEDYDVYSLSQGGGLIAKETVRRQGLRKKMPVEDITWDQAQGFCRWLGKHTGLNYDLPSEAQWEYAARSRGKNLAYATDTGMPEYGVNISREERLRRPGSYSSNPLGLYDMSGNAKEWVLDWFDPDYYKKSPEEDPRGPKTGDEKVVRSGEVVFQRFHKRKEASSEIAKDFGYKGHPYVGFRCAVNETNPIKLK